MQTDLTPMNREQAPTTADEAAEVVARTALGDPGRKGAFADSAGVVAR